jgi:hypothetical protein
LGEIVFGGSSVYIYMEHGFIGPQVLARLRQDLRERLMSGTVSGVWDVLAAFRCLAEADPALIPEYRRWSLRFDLLAADGFRTAA